MSSPDLVLRPGTDLPTPTELAAAFEESGLTSTWFSVQVSREGPWRLLSLFVDGREAAPMEAVQPRSDLAAHVDISEHLEGGGPIRLQWLVSFGDDQPRVAAYVAGPTGVVRYPVWKDVVPGLKVSGVHLYPKPAPLVPEGTPQLAAAS